MTVPRPTRRAALNVRFATPADRRALERLAQGDSARPPQLPALVAELDGRLAAALPLRSGDPVADPFQATAELVRLLELRVAQLNGTAAGGARSFETDCGGAGRRRGTPRRLSSPPQSLLPDPWAGAGVVDSPRSATSRSPTPHPSTRNAGWPSLD